MKSPGSGVNGAGGSNPRAAADDEYRHEANEGQKTFFDMKAPMK